MEHKRQQLIIENEHQILLRSKLIDLQGDLLEHKANNKMYFEKSHDLRIQTLLIKELLAESKERIENL